MKSPKKRGAFAALLVSALVLSGCAAGDDNGNESAGGDNGEVVFVEAAGTSPQNLNPVTNTDVTVGSMSSAVFETLVRLDSAFDVQPLVAESWDFSEDGLSLTIHVREGVKWHDGEPFTSEDVRFNLEEVLPLAPIGSDMATHIASIELPDELTAEITFSSAFGPSLETLSRLKLLPAHLYAGTDIATNDASNTPIGTGPFTFAEYVSGDRMVLAKNPDYWGGEPAIDKIILKIMPDANARMLALQAGEVDRIQPLYTDQAQLSQLTGDEYLLAPASGAGQSMTMSFNTRVEPLGDPEVRRAIVEAINREAIVNGAYYGNAEVARGPVPPQFEWAVSDEVDFSRDIAYDPEAAGRKLDELGYPIGADGTRFTMNLSTMNGFSAFVSTAEIIKGNLEEIGIAVNLTVEDFNVHVDNVYTKHEFGASLIEFSPYDDPNLGVSRLYVCNPDDKAYVNPSGVCDAQVDEGFAISAGTVNRAERAAGLLQAERRVEELLYVVPLVTTLTKGVMRQDRWDGIDEFQFAWGGSYDWTALKPAA